MNLIYFSKFFVFCIDNIVGNIEVFNMKKIIIIKILKKNSSCFFFNFYCCFYVMYRYMFYIVFGEII